MYCGFCLREAQSVMFYEGLRLWGGPRSNDANAAGGSAKEGPHVRGGSELGSYEDLMNVSRILALSEAQAVVFYEGLRLGGRAQFLTA